MPFDCSSSCSLLFYYFFPHLKHMRLIFDSVLLYVHGNQLRSCRYGQLTTLFLCEPSGDSLPIFPVPALLRWNQWKICFPQTNVPNSRGRRLKSGHAVYRPSYRVRYKKLWAWWPSWSCDLDHLHRPCSSFPRRLYINCGFDLPSVFRDDVGQ